MNTQSYKEVLLIKRYSYTDARETICFSGTALEELRHVNVTRCDKTGECTIEFVFGIILNDDDFMMIVSDEDISSISPDDLNPMEFDSLMKLMNRWLYGLENAYFSQVIDGANGAYKLIIHFGCKAKEYENAPQISLTYNRDLIL